MPSLSGSEKAPLYALTNVGRTGATRSGYVGRSVFATVSGAGGSFFILAALRKTLEIEELTGPDPNTATVTVRGNLGYVPRKYAEIVLSLGSLSNRLFAGHILSITQIRKRAGERFPRYRLEMADYAWLIGTRRVWGRQWTTTSMNEIAQSLVDDFAPSGFTTLIETSLPAVTFSTNQGETLPEALSRLCQQVASARWYVDYDKVIHLFLGDEANATRASDIDQFSRIWDLEYETDASQVRTRIAVRGASTRVTANVAAGATSVAVADTTLFRDAGGSALLGGNRLTYTGITPGSAPAGTLTGVPASGEGSILYPAASGDAIALLEESVETTGAAAIGALLGTDGYIDHTLDDQAIVTAAAAILRGQSDLADNPYQGERLLRFRTRDPSFQANRRVTISLGFDDELAGDEAFAGWPLTDVDTGSTSAEDVGPGGYDLTVANPLPAIPGPIDGQTAAAFDGSGDVQLTRAAFPMPGAALSLEIWFNSALTDPQGVWFYDEPTRALVVGVEGGIVGVNPGSVHVIVNNTLLTVPTSIDLTDGEWHQLVVTWVAFSGLLTVYVDGGEVSSGTLEAGFTLPATGLLEFGRELA